MGAGRLRPPSDFDPDRQASLHLHWSRFRSWKLTPDLMSTTRSVWFFVIALTVIRLSMLATTELEFDEAHYWMWSERLAPAYFSKGPGIAFAMRASTAIFGANEFGVRFFSPVLAAGTSLLMFYFARRLFGGSDRSLRGLACIYCLPFSLFARSRRLSGTRNTPGLP